MLTNAYGRPICGAYLGDDDEPCNLAPGHQGGCGGDGSLDPEWLAGQLAAVTKERDQMRSAHAQLAELHAIATSHNPQPPSPEVHERFLVKKRELEADPEKAAAAWANVQRAIESRVEMSAESRKECEAAWDTWDAEREPHAKTVAMLRLAETVAMWIEHAEAVERQRDDLVAMLERLVDQPIALGDEYDARELIARAKGETP